MSTPARRLDIRESNEALILRAAEKQFALHGFRGTTTEDIANEARLPKANVHYYFGTKANLYRQVLKHILEDWMDAAAAFEDDEDPFRMPLHARALERLRGERRRGAVEKHRQAGAERDAVETARQELAT